MVEAEGGGRISRKKLRDWSGKTQTQTQMNWAEVLVLLLGASVLYPIAIASTSGSPKSDDGERKCPPCQQASPTRFAYLVNVHDARTLSDAVPLLDSISAPNNIVFVHIDKKFPFELYSTSDLYWRVKECDCGIREVQSLYECKWARWSINKPVLWAIDKLTASFRGKYDKFITLSGDSLPTLGNVAMGTIFKKHLKEYNFVTSMWSETGLQPTR